MNVVKHLACVWHWYGINLDWVYSLNHRTSPSFVAQELPRFFRWLSKAWSMRAAVMLLRHIHICMCLTLMWDQFWLGLQPQSLHFIIIFSPGITQISRWLPKAWSMRTAVMLYRHIHIFTSTAHESFQIPCMCPTLMWDQVWLGLQPQSPHFTIICCPGITQISR